MIDNMRCLFCKWFPILLILGLCLLVYHFVDRAPSTTEKAPTTVSAPG